MENKSIGLKILWGAVTILSARVLLFTIPVLINKLLAKNLSPLNIADWYMLTLTFSALLYLVVGIAALGQHKHWFFFHFFVAILVLLLTGGLYAKVVNLSVDMKTVYFIPAVVAVCITIFTLGLKGKVKTT